MIRTRSLTALLGMALLTTARAADFATTARFTPNLHEEGNPLVTQLGAGWGVLVAVNLAALIFCGVCAAMYARARPRVEAAAGATSAWDFAGRLFYGRALHPAHYVLRKFTQIRPPPRAHRRAWMEWIGYTLPPVLTVASLTAVFAWYATRQWHLEGFATLYGMTGLALYPLVGIPVLIGLEIRYVRREFARARAAGPHA